MAGKTRTRKKAAPVAEVVAIRPLRRAFRFIGRILAGVGGVYLALILVFAFVPPPINFYQLQETIRLGGIEKDWVSMDEIAPVMARSSVASEDANFCLHWGFDMGAIRAALDEGNGRGASTISQQTVKNVFCGRAGVGFARPPRRFDPRCGTGLDQTAYSDCVPECCRIR